MALRLLYMKRSGLSPGELEAVQFKEDTVRILIPALMVGAALLGAPTAAADVYFGPTLVVNVGQVNWFPLVQNTKVTVIQSNTAPATSNGNVSVNVATKACTVRCGAGATVPVKSTRGQARR